MPRRTYSVILFAIYLWYSFVNLTMLDADIITHNIALGFASERITNITWIRDMFVPTLAVNILVFASFVFAFRKDLLGIRFAKVAQEEPDPMTAGQKFSAVVIAVTAVLWMTSALHGINNTVITLAATVLLFLTGALAMKDWKAIDFMTLIFFTAAISIGGVMDHCGAASKVFGSIRGLFPQGYSMRYVLTIVFIIMALHLLVGSITTSVSIIVPGLLVLTGGIVPERMVVYLSVLYITGQIFLPFHSVVNLIGETRGYYTSRYTAIMGIYETVILLFAIPFIYVPYWNFIGLL